MANHAEQRRGPRIAEVPERRPIPEPSPVPAPSVPAALEKLASATQRVISKRIDLVTLESHELISALITKAGLITFGVIVGLAAWFAGLAGTVLYLLPHRGMPMHLAVYAAVNASIAAVVVFVALRKNLPTLGGEVADEHTDRVQNIRRSSGDQEHGE
ncbi:MAG TPA: hypothetical protein VN634_12870 [Candidatus Limnocylindrales bacterium]|nr:hypothetical protein [Candidatus Limnocylindrales bacterium]